MNGSSLHVSKADGRTIEARRFRDVLGEIVSHLGGSNLPAKGSASLRAVGDLKASDAMGQARYLSEPRRAEADARDDVEITRAALARNEAVLVDPSVTSAS